MNIQPTLRPVISFREQKNFPAKNVFATYDTTPAGHRALELIERISLQFEIKLFLHPFDYIENPANYEEASAEAAEAQLILISSWKESQYPEVLRRLIRSCSISHEEGDVTVVELTGPEGRIEATDLLTSRFMD